MTVRKSGQAQQNPNHFIGKVVNRGDGKKGKKDSTESGRVQLRIHGMNSGSGMSDQDLLWGVPLMPIGTGASLDGVGTAPIGLKNDSTVFGFFADAERTVPIIMGVLHKAGGDGGQDGTSLKAAQNDIPDGARSQDTEGGDKNDILGIPFTEEEHAKKGQHHHKKKTVGSVQYRGEEVFDLISQGDPQNESGAVGEQAVKNSKSIVDLLSQGGGFMGGFQGLMSGNMSIGSILGQAQGMLSGMGGGGGGGGGGSASGMPMMNPQQSYNNNQMTIGGIVVTTTVDQNTTTAQYGNIVVTITNNVGPNGAIIDSVASISASGVTRATGSITEVMRAASTISPYASSVFQAAQITSASSHATNNAFNTPPSTGQQQGGGGGGGGMQQFMGPLQSLMSMMGGLQGMMGMESDSASLLGPLTENFTAATGIAGQIKTTAKSIFGNSQAPTSAMSNMMGNLMGQSGLGNIAGISNLLSGTGITSILTSVVGAAVGQGGGGGSAGVFGMYSPMGSSMQSVINGNFTPNSLMNSSIQLPQVNRSSFNQVYSRNPGVNIGINNNISPSPPTIKRANTTIVGEVTPMYQYNSSTAGVNSLQNTSVEVNNIVGSNNAVQSTLNKNAGVNYTVNTK